MKSNRRERRARGNGLLRRRTTGGLTVSASFARAAGQGNHRGTESTECAQGPRGSCICPLCVLGALCVSAVSFLLNRRGSKGAVWATVPRMVPPACVEAPAAERIPPARTGQPIPVVLIGNGQYAQSWPEGNHRDTEAPRPK